MALAERSRPPLMEQRLSEKEPPLPETSFDPPNPTAEPAAAASAASAASAPTSLFGGSWIPVLSWTAFVLGALVVAVSMHGPLPKQFAPEDAAVMGARNSNMQDLTSGHGFDPNAEKAASGFGDEVSVHRVPKFGDEEEPKGDSQNEAGEAGTHAVPKLGEEATPEGENHEEKTHSIPKFGDEDLMNRAGNFGDGNSDGTMDVDYDPTGTGKDSNIRVVDGNDESQDIPTVPEVVQDDGAAGGPQGAPNVQVVSQNQPHPDATTPKDPPIVVTQQPRGGDVGKPPSNQVTQETETVIERNSGPNLPMPPPRTPSTPLEKTECEPTPDIPFKSLSNEDEAVFEVFYSNPHICHGVMVDMGTSTDGLSVSPSFFFEYALDWQTIMIAGNPDSYEAQTKNRANAVHHHAVFCPVWVDSLQFYKGVFYHQHNAKEGQEPIFSVETVNAAPPATTAEEEEEIVHVPCQRLSNIFTDVKHIDVFYLSTSGDEFAAFKTMDWTTRVSVWVIELDGTNPRRDERVRKTLRERKYVQAEWDVRRWCPDEVGHCLPNEVWLETGFNPVPDMRRRLQALEDGRYRRRLQVESVGEKSHLRHG